MVCFRIQLDDSLNLRSSSVANLTIMTAKCLARVQASTHLKLGFRPANAPGEHAAGGNIEMPSQNNILCFSKQWLSQSLATPMVPARAELSN